MATTYVPTHSLDTVLPEETQHEPTYVGYIAGLILAAALIVGLVSEVGRQVAILYILLTFITWTHEMVHAIVARRGNIEVLKVQTGFGPKLFEYTASNGIVHSWKILPLGGYTRMTDETHGNASVTRRVAVALSAPLMNIACGLLAVGITLAIYGMPAETWTVHGVDGPNASHVVDGDQLRATSDSSGEIVIYKISGTSDQDTPLILDSNFDVTPNVNQPAGPVRAASEVGGIITNAPAVLINTIRGKSSIVTLALTAPWGETTTDWLARLLMSFGMLSLIIGLFNLTPIPPFDGGGALMNIITGLAERRGKQAAEAVGKASSKLVWVGYGFMAFCLIWPFI